MAPLLAALISAGPSLIRMFGESKGGTTERVAHTVAEVVQAIGTNPTASQVKQLESVVNQQPSEEISKLSVELARIAAEREQNAMNYDVAMHTQQQETIRASKDVKGVRPEIANRHSWFTAVYVIGMELAHATGLTSFGASMEIAMMLAAPTLAWFGFRTFDKFSRHGAS